MFRSIFRDGLFAEKVMIVTGGGSGIGRATAHELASLGATVVVSGRKAEKLEKVVGEIERGGGTAVAHRCNIRKEDEVKELFSAVLDQFGAVHGLVNNAGGQFISPAEFITLKGWNAVVETNLTGTFLMCREAFNRYMGKHGGAIVNMLMENGRGFPGMAHSAAARAGVENMTKTLAVEWAKAGVRINAVAPGLIESSGLETYGEAAKLFIDESIKDIPLKRMGSESEVSSVITFLLSPAASYITGETVRIDGASSLWRKTWPIDDHDKAPPPFDGFS